MSSGSPAKSSPIFVFSFKEPGRREEVLEKARPAAFLTDLATSCGARDAVLSEMKRYSEAGAS